MTDERPILFLDVDGVLNTTGVYFSTDFNPAAVSNLKEVLEQTNVQVFVISQWRLSPRHLDNLRAKFTEAGIRAEAITGTTVEIDLFERNLEVRAAIEKHKPARFAIVDDEPAYYGDDHELKQNAVFVNPKEGLNETAKEKLLERLTK